MSKILLYQFGGSRNHGCEALVRTVKTLLISENITVLTNNFFEDNKFLSNNNINIVKNSFNNKKPFIKKIYYKLNKIILNKKIEYNNNKKIPRKLNDILNKQNIFIAIGGDNYCYSGGKGFYRFDNLLRKKNKIMVLLGCSLEKELMNNDLISNLHQFDLITARESITFNTLILNGFKNIALFPDSAFILDLKKVDLPINFIEGKTIGINLSPLIQNQEMTKNITFSNYKYLIEYIINNSTNNIVLIPHVVWKNNDDLTPLKKLYNLFKNTGRVCIVDEEKKLNCMQLKYIISKCKMFVCARTHASIAAYSTCVPTLVVGYSVKAKGIAKDIFGTFDNYVLPVQSLKNENDLLNAYKWLETNENNIREHLNNVMPDYISKAWQAGEAVKGLIKSIEN